jgi:hypothetical protein
MPDSETLRVSADSWKDLKTIIHYRTFRTKVGAETTAWTDQYSISSAVLFADAFRGTGRLKTTSTGVLTCYFEKTLVGRDPEMPRSI